MGTLRPTREMLDRLTPLPMGVAALLFLLFAAGELHFFAEPLFRPLLSVCHAGLIAVWPVFLVEAFVQRAAGNPRWRTHLHCCLCPPLRLGARDATTGKRIWLIRTGWIEVESGLAERVERFLNRPMVGIALLVIPLLALDHYEAEHHPIVTEVEHLMQARMPGLLAHGESGESGTGQIALVTLTRVGEALIWMAFALEFIVMTSVVDRKLRYLRQHWIDALIIVLPLVAFLRATRLLRLTRLNQVTRFVRAYRLRGSVMRAQRGLMIATFLERVLGRTPEGRQARLNELLADKEHELRMLRAEIRDVQSRLDADHGRADAA